MKDKTSNFARKPIVSGSRCAVHSNQRERHLLKRGQCFHDLGGEPELFHYAAGAPEFGIDFLRLVEDRLASGN